jgi:hypothetical protein
MFRSIIIRYVKFIGVCMRLNYENSSVEEIATYWLSVTRATVSCMRKNHKNNITMSAKLEEAYKLYKKMLLQRKIDILSYYR